MSDSGRGSGHVLLSAPPPSLAPPNRSSLAFLRFRDSVVDCSSSGRLIWFGLAMSDDASLFMAL